MQIDWVVVISQIVNFLILVWLLKHFLYGPITNAMENRRQAIKDQIKEAQQREEIAEDKAREYEEKVRQLEQQREEFLEKARTEAEQNHEELLEAARREVEALEERWRENLREERESFLRELRDRMGERVCAVAREVLSDLADTELQQQIVSVFVERLGALDEESLRDLRDAVKEVDRAPVMTSAFELSAADRERIENALRSALGSETTIKFRQSEDLRCGLELSIGGRKISWSIEGYLDSLEESISETLHREADEDADTDEPREAETATTTGESQGE